MGCSVCTCIARDGKHAETMRLVPAKPLTFVTESGAGCAHALPNMPSMFNPCAWCLPSPKATSEAPFEGANTQSPHCSHFPLRFTHPRHFIHERYHGTSLSAMETGTPSCRLLVPTSQRRRPTDLPLSIKTTGSVLHFQVRALPLCREVQRPDPQKSN